MKKISAILLTLAAARGAASTAPFIAPQAHPIARYEAGWKKNPFTLKTAPNAVTKESFARDLALAGWRQAGDDSIVILVNTKTREYSRLKNNEPGSDGTKVKTAHLEDRHADTFVELERNNDTAMVRYDESFLRQMAAQGAAAKPNPSVPMRAPNAGGPYQPPGVNGNTAKLPQPVAAPNIIPQGAAAGRQGVMPTVPNPQLPQSFASPANNVPTPQRRRLNTMPQPIQR